MPVWEQLATDQTDPWRGKLFQDRYLLPLTAY